MTKQEFVALDELEQLQVLCRKGVHLMDRIDSGYYYSLYQLHSFYVELGCGIRGDWQNIHVFQGIIFLEPYLKKIDVGVYL